MFHQMKRKLQGSWGWAGAIVGMAAVYYYMKRNATTPGAMAQEAASDIKSVINTTASSANKAVDTVAGAIPK